MRWGSLRMGNQVSICTRKNNCKLEYSLLFLCDSWRKLSPAAGGHRHKVRLRRNTRPGLRGHRDEPSATCGHIHPVSVSILRPNIQHTPALSRVGHTISDWLAQSKRAQGCQHLRSAAWPSQAEPRPPKTAPHAKVCKVLNFGASQSHVGNASLECRGKAYGLTNLLRASRPLL